MRESNQVASIVSDLFHRMLTLSLQKDKYKSINVKAPLFQELLDAHPTLSIVFAAAGFRFDYCACWFSPVTVGAFRFTSESKTKRMIRILSAPVNVFLFSSLDL